MNQDFDRRMSETPDLFLGMRPDISEKKKVSTSSAVDIGIALGDSSSFVPDTGLLGTENTPESGNEDKSGTQPDTGPEYANESIIRNISEFVSSELRQWNESHQKQLGDLAKTQKQIDHQITKYDKELKRLDQRSFLLNKRIENIKVENQTLQETISQLENILKNVPDAVQGLTHIKDKLWEGALQINPEKKRHIHLLKKLTLTRFNSSNEKHAALLQKYLQLHNNYSPDLSVEEQWAQLGFPHDSSNSLDTTGILGLQNLVYFSERNTTLARKMYSSKEYHFPSVGVSVSALLITILGLCSNESNLPANEITKTFVRLMDHPKAFEELYCVCLRLYDKAVQAGDTDPLKTTETQIRALLVASPKDLQQLINNSESL